MTPSDIAKVNRRLKSENMKIRRYGDGHALFDISAPFVDFMDYLSVADMSSTVDELVAICRSKDTRWPGVKDLPPFVPTPKKKGVARKPRGPKDVRGQLLAVGDLVAYGCSSGSTLYCHYVVRITPSFVWMAADRDVRRPKGNARREHNRVAIVEKAKN